MKIRRIHSQRMDYLLQLNNGFIVLYEDELSLIKEATAIYIQIHDYFLVMMAMHVSQDVSLIFACKMFFSDVN